MPLSKTAPRRPLFRNRALLIAWGIVGLLGAAILATGPLIFVVLFRVLVPGPEEVGPEVYLLGALGSLFWIALGVAVLLSLRAAIAGPRRKPHGHKTPGVPPDAQG